MINISCFSSLGKFRFKSSKVVHVLTNRNAESEICGQKKKMSGGGGGRKNFRKRPAAGSDDEEQGSAVVLKAKQTSSGPLVASTAKPKKKDDAFYESARTAVPSIGKDNGATATIIDEEVAGSIGSTSEAGLLFN